MGRILVVATAGAGGDFQPLVALSLAMHRRGPALSLLGDAGVRASLAGLPIETEVIPVPGPRAQDGIRSEVVSPEGASLSVDVIGSGSPETDSESVSPREVGNGRPVSVSDGDGPASRPREPWEHERPGLVIDGRIRSYGRVPSAGVIAAWLSEGPSA